MLGLGLGASKIRRADTGGFSYSDISGFELLLNNNTDFLNGGSIVVTDPVSAWTDQSSNALAFTQGTGVEQPTFTALTPDAVQFDGTADNYNIDSVLTTGINTSTQGYIGFWIRPIDGTPAGAEFPLAFGDTDDAARLSIQHATDGKIIVIVSSTVAEQWRLGTTAAALATATWTHVALYTDGVAAELRIDNVVVAQSFSTPTDKTVWFNALSAELDNGRIAALNFSGSGNGFECNSAIDELVMFSTLPTTDQMTQIFEKVPH